jgi:hypothetical protein
MSSSFVNSHSGLDEVDAAEIRRELERIVASPVFRGSKRCQSFLQFVVARTLEGDGKNLKERTLAIEVFGRDEGEDLTDDSIVRVGAREVRKRLAQYYVDAGAHDSLRIELPAGSYVPVFHHQAQTSPIEIAPVSNFPAARTDLRPAGPVPALEWFRRKGFVIAAVAVLALSSALIWRVTAARRDVFDMFWRPAFADRAAPMILLAHPIVYEPSSRASRLDEQINGVANPAAQRVLRVPANLLDGADYVPSLDQFVGFGDAEAALRVSSLFVQHHVNVAVRMASRVDFYDLRGASVVLIGAFTNRWTMELTKGMRYQFSYGGGKPCIEEGKGGCRWTLTTKSDNGKSTEDYVLVSRLPHPATNGFVVIAAGLNVYGTEEAGRILSSPDFLKPIIKRLPEHWADHNLQLVLHVSVIGDAPAQSEVVAVHTW